MKQILQGIAFILIVIGCFWVGMKWGAITPNGATSQHPTTRPPVVIPTVPDVPAVISSEVESPSAPTPTQSVSGVVDNGEKVDLPLPKNDKINHYENTHFGYAFDVPVNVYYSGFGGQGSALHTVGIAKDVPDTFADAAIRIYFYGKKIPSELQNTSKYEDPAGKYVLILLSNQTAVRVEANNIAHPVVQKIVQTIVAR